MTLRTNARLAGFTFLIYIAIAVTSMILSRQVMSGVEGTVAKLASITQHASLMRVDILLTMFQAACALILAVSLYALTRNVNRDLAVIALCCRVGEGMIIILATFRSLALLSIAASTATATNTIADLLLKMEDWLLFASGTCFAMGSTIYCYLFLRARSIPVPLAWLGVLASIVALVVVPLQLAGFIDASVSGLIWIPLLVFEVALALWLLIKKVVVPPEQELA